MDDLLRTLSDGNLTVYLFGALGGMLGLILSYGEIVKILRILRTQTSTLNAMGDLPPGGDFEIIGKADSERILQSPITKKACVFWDVTVSEQRGSGKHARWVTVYQRRSNEPFGVYDGTGRMIVLPDGLVEFVLHDDLKKSSSTFFAMDEQTATALKELGVDTKGDLNFNKTMRVHERYIEKGDELFLIGNRLNNDPTDARKAGQPLIVSDYSERQLAGRFLWQAVVKTALGVGFGVFVFFVLANP